jgi:glycosyltransferase involved in cell wall biosynthesis
MPTVTFFQRKRRPNQNYSIEFIFSDVRARLEGRIVSRVRVAPFVSKGLLRRLFILADAVQHQTGVSHVTGDIAFVAIGLRPRDTVLTVHDCVRIGQARGVRRWVLREFWLTLPVRRASIITTVSEATRQEVLDLTGCSPAKVKVIPVAVSDAFQFKPRTFNEDYPRILQIGTAPNKNVPRLVRALEGRRCQLVIVGTIEASLAELLEQTKADYVALHDLSLDQLLSEYEAADLVTFASTEEGFGMPIVEANRIGRPVLSSQASSMPEVAGDAACLVDPKSVESIRAGLTRIIDDREYREDLVQRGLKNATRFDGDRIANAYLEIYQRLSGV